MYPDDIDPTEPPPKPPSEASSVKRAQEALRERGYTLTALGPYRVSFFRTDAERDRYGLIPEADWRHLTPKRFAQFLKDTPPLANPPRPKVDVEPPKLPKVRGRRQARPS